MSLKYRIQAYRVLYKRYREVFSHFWKIRKNLKGDLFNEQEAAFLPAALSIQERPVSVTARLTARVLMALIVIALLWAVFGKIDIVVNAKGKIIPSDYNKTISAIEIAAVRALHVREGQSVKAGDVLVELDSSSTDADHEKAQHALIEAQLQEARAAALLTAIETKKPPSLPRINELSEHQWRQAQFQLESQYNDFLRKLMRLDSQITHYAAALPLAEQQAHDYKALVANHDIAKHAWLEKEQAYLELKRQLSDARNQRASLIAQTRKEAWDMLAEGRKIAAANAQDAKRNQAHSRLLKLIAPVDGTVQQLTAHTVGGVVPAAQALMQIVPKEQHVIVDASIENKDVGFVHAGQNAAVKIDTFDYSKYGTIAARILQVSRDAIQDEKKGLIYSIKVLLDQPHIDIEDKTVPLTAGMSVNVEIKTGERRVIEYLLSPLIRHQHEALRER